MDKVKRFDIVALGELLIDFTDSGRSPDGMKLFEQNPGGAPANMLTAASHMGFKTAFIGKVGCDMHGSFLIDTLRKENIDTKAIIEDKDYFTTLAFVALDENGERTFSFARKPGADTMLREDEIDIKLLEDCKIFHFGSLSLTDEPSCSATLFAVKTAKKAGAIISYDPNYRASLWADQKTATDKMRSVIPLVDVMKVSDEESLMLTGCTDYFEAADKLLSSGVKLVSITLGSDGVIIARSDKMEKFDAFKVECVDTTGAGDSFWGGFLSRFLSVGNAIDEMSWDEVRKCARSGNAVAALCVQKRGGIPSIPSREEVTEILKGEI